MSSVVEFLATGGRRCYHTNWQRDTKTPVICKPQITGSQRIILENYLFISWASAAGDNFFCLFCEETGFYSGKYLYNIIYLSSILNPYTQQQSPLSALMPYGRGPGDCTQVVTPHYSMENIHTAAVVQMTNFSKQAELGEKGLLGSKQFLHSFKLSPQSMKEAPVFLPSWDLIYKMLRTNHSIFQHHF